MKIESVRAHLIHTSIPPEKRVESGAGLKLARQMCLIEIRTDDGAVGVGSPSGPYDLAVLKRVVEDVIAPHLVGCDPGDIPFLWHRLYHGEISRNLGHRGVGIAALSGIDIALWDLRGRVTGQPLHQLLGGRYHPDGVRVYASSIYWDLAPQEAASQAESWVERGFTAVKVKIGANWRRDVANLSAIRAAIGTDVDLLVDANQALGRIEATRVLDALEELECYWFEEPISIDDIEGHRHLRAARRTVRIATGENLYTRHAFADLVRADAVDVMQADASRAGGLTEARRISDLASCHGLDWNPHTFNDIITVAANLHLVAASAHPAMFEWDITHNDLMTDLADLPLAIKEGCVQPPDGPGLGFEIDWDFVAAHPWNGQPSIGAGHGMRR
ncbi:mandelate racemase/muconate lactonizing enzyme family protein [Nitriliruptor alkaliphilus]|uniref:mandelate racemase/muconate lactonizing enzyme family protein n=1 Tax=Nitriliruptor alkaliphilus TaxID=427918 RepID=UPI000696AAA8|nr:mandelate racemase/muconate lactonizing enzyme family protein [Nitriliruptor alkaliphilus]